MIDKELFVLLRGSCYILLEVLEFIFWDIFLSLLVFNKVEEFGIKEELLGFLVIGIDVSIIVSLGFLGPTYFSSKGSAFCKYVELSSAND